MLVAFIPAHAVLKEQDLEKTLGILRQELTNTHDDNEKSSEVMKKRNQEILERVFNTFRQSNQNALMLYSQKDGYVFDQAYACHEATEQYRAFKQLQLPFHSFLNRTKVDIARYDSLIISLQEVPDAILSKSAQENRNARNGAAAAVRHKNRAVGFAVFLDPLPDAFLHQAAFFMKGLQNFISSAHAAPRFLSL